MFRPFAQGTVGPDLGMHKPSTFPYSHVPPERFERPWCAPSVVVDKTAILYGVASQPENCFAGLGPTVDSLRDNDIAILPKTKFSMCTDEVRALLSSMPQIENICLFGIEVCPAGESGLDTYRHACEENSSLDDTLNGL